MTNGQDFNISFIALIESYPCLYDFSVNDSIMKDIRDQAWESIADQTSSTVGDCKERWKNLRGSFTRHLKLLNRPCGSRARLKKPYYLAEYLHFLRPFLKVADMTKKIKARQKSRMISIPEIGTQATRDIYTNEKPIKVYKRLKNDKFRITVIKKENTFEDDNFITPFVKEEAVLVDDNFIPIVGEEVIFEDDNFLTHFIKKETILEDDNFKMPFIKKVSNCEDNNSRVPVIKKTSDCEDDNCITPFIKKETILEDDKFLSIVEEEVILNDDNFLTCFIKEETFLEDDKSIPIVKKEIVQDNNIIIPLIKEENNPKDDNSITPCVREVNINVQDSAFFVDAKKAPSEIEFKEVAITSIKANDPDFEFLQSVRSNMKKMNSDQKTQFKIGILNMADEILSGCRSQIS